MAKEPNSSVTSLKEEEQFFSSLRDTGRVKFILDVHPNLKTLNSIEELKEEIEKSNGAGVEVLVLGTGKSDNSLKLTHANVIGVNNKKEYFENFTSEDAPNIFNKSKLDYFLIFGDGNNYAYTHNLRKGIHENKIESAPLPAKSSKVEYHVGLPKTAFMGGNVFLIKEGSIQDYVSPVNKSALNMASNGENYTNKKN